VARALRAGQDRHARRTRSTGTAGGTTLQRALAAFDHATVDVIAFGHSHTPYCERHGAIWVINPGSPTDKRFSPRYSYAILEVAEGLVTPRLVHFDDRRP
jgi:hypothetical protein